MKQTRQQQRRRWQRQRLVWINARLATQNLTRQQRRIYQLLLQCHYLYVHSNNNQYRQYHQYNNHLWIEWIESRAAMRNSHQSSSPNLTIHRRQLHLLRKTNCHRRHRHMLHNRRLKSTIYWGHRSPYWCDSSTNRGWDFSNFYRTGKPNLCFFFANSATHDKLDSSAIPRDLDDLQSVLHSVFVFANYKKRMIHCFCVESWRWKRFVVAIQISWFQTPLAIK